MFPTVLVTVKHCSQNVDVNGPHHGPYQLMASSSLHCHRLVGWGRHNELEASMVGAVYVHVLRTLLWNYLLILLKIFVSLRSIFKLFFPLTHVSIVSHSDHCCLFLSLCCPRWVPRLPTKSKNEIACEHLPNVCNFSKRNELVFPVSQNSGMNEENWSLKKREAFVWRKRNPAHWLSWERENHGWRVLIRIRFWQI